MINIEELNKTWAEIFQNQECKGRKQKIDYENAVKHGKEVIKDLTEADMMELPVEILQIVTKINKLYFTVTEPDRI